MSFVGPMAAINPWRSPSIELPLPFFVGAVCWTAVAGLLLAVLDGSLWLSRWHPQLLALVHCVVLGILGQTSIGALLQFLPAAVGAVFRTPLGGWRILCGGWNAGIALMVAGWLGGLPLGTGCGAVMVAVCTMNFCIAALHSLGTSNGDCLPRVRLALPLLMWPVVAVLGLILLGAINGFVALDLSVWTDIHAIGGIGGVYLVLLLAVAPIALPLLLGTRRGGLPTRVMAFLALFVVVATIVARAASQAHFRASSFVGATLIILSLSTFTVLVRRRFPRNRPLLVSWMLGCCTACASGLIWASSTQTSALVAATLLVAGSLPLLILSMMLEIQTFICWIHLHRRVGRGQQLPGVHVLLPDRLKWWWVLVQILAATTTALAAWLADPWLSRSAGGLWLLAASMLALSIWWSAQSAHQFLAKQAAA